MLKSLKSSFFIALGLAAYTSASVDTTYLFAKDELNPRIKPSLAVACFLSSKVGYVLVYSNSKLVQNNPDSNLVLMKTNSIKAAFDECETTFRDRDSQDFKSVRWGYWSEFDGETGIEDLTLGAQQGDEATGQILSFPLGNKLVASQAVEGLEKIEDYVTNTLNPIYQADDISLSNGARQIKKKIIEKDPDLAQDGWKRWGLDLVL